MPSSAACVGIFRSATWLALSYAFFSTMPRYVTESRRTAVAAWFDRIKWARIKNEVKMMMRLMLGAVVAGVLMFGSMGCEMTGHKDASASACKACVAGKEGKSVWCDECNKGYVAGKAVSCKGYFAEKTGGPKCEKCAAKKKG